MANLPKERFDAAVKVIHSLPKDGPFQPSYDMMLTFYSYFKQATEGKCTRPKPWAWDIVNKKKWDAWTNLGDMPQEEAMVKYVEELKKTIKHFTEKGLAMKEKGDPRIVEAMPQNEEVQAFMEKLGSFYEIVDEDSPVPRVPKDSPSLQTENHIPAEDETDENTDERTPLEIFDHSQMVENVLKKSEEVNNILDQSEEALLNGGEDDNDVDDKIDDVDQEQSVVSSKVQKEEKDIITMNGDHIHITESKLTMQAYPRREKPPFESKDRDSRGRRERNKNRPPVSGDHVTSETDSEEEFCDTSDQPSQDETDAVPIYPTVANSTPIKPGTVIGNHIRLGSQEHNHSSLPFTPSKSRLLGFGVSSRGMSESLLVNGPGQETMNLSYCSSGKEDDHCGDKRDLDSNTSNFDSSDKDVRVLGGGDMSPPGGYSQGQGQTMVRQNLRGRQMGARQNQQGVSSGSQSYSGAGGGGGRGHEETPMGGPPGSIDAQMALALIRLQQDMNRVMERVSNLEKAQTEQGKNTTLKKDKKVSQWWPFDFNRQSLFALLVWPLIVHWILLKLFHRRRHRPQ
ncbi:acyl-CoA-binding domain-containing protein 5-like isoform X1 [Crassostrea angulata]|uniref:acyl-CoA-binding domain-containing protein 5-like isoform X1 n=1 Tax=Magallana angulata TaxID=2784310 RepID=UPI0022B10109|nr:acyl-CoA-binding domain-containing protein 5-like isoform X1 [Crassostrea angulata]